MAGNLRVIELQNDLEQLDREWNLHRESFYVSGKNGHRSPPSVGGGIFGVIIAIVFGIIFLSMFLGSGSGRGDGPPGIIIIFFLLIIGFAIFASISEITKSNGMQDAEAHYRNRRTRLLRSIDDARRNR